MASSHPRVLPSTGPGNTIRNTIGGQGQATDLLKMGDEQKMKDSMKGNNEYRPDIHKCFTQIEQDALPTTSPMVRMKAAEDFARRQAKDWVDSTGSELKETAQKVLEKLADLTTPDTEMSGATLRESSFESAWR